MAKLFLSHSSRDNAAAVAISDWLRENGWDDIFLDFDPQRGIKGGERWEQALNQAASRCEAVVFLVSRAWLGSDWCLKEFGLAAKLNKRLLGALIESIPVTELPVYLTGTWQLIDLSLGQPVQRFTVAMPFTGEAAEVSLSSEGLLRLREGLRSAGLDPTFFAWPPPGEPARSPYPGLRPLEAEDAGVFFGREAQIIEALDRMRAVRDGSAFPMICVLGASGSGKSSFLRAGIWPRLTRDDRNFLPLPVVRPGRAAMTGQSGFAASLAQAFEEACLDLTKREAEEAIRSGARAVRAILRRLSETATRRSVNGAYAKPPLPVLAIDQAEELFVSEGVQEGKCLLALLRDLLTGGERDLAVLLTIRSDAVERLQLASSMENVPFSTITFSSMSKGLYASLIEQPAARLADTDRPLVVEPTLVRALLEDMEGGGGRDALPLLAFTLERIWLEFGETGRLTLNNYESLGRVRGSIEAAVERAFTAADADLSVPPDRAARLALLRRALIPWLAGIDPDTGSPRRRVARRAEIPTEASPLVDRLIEQRLLSADVDPRTGEATVEPAHEALLRQWGTLSGWLEADFGVLATLESVRRGARDWEANDRGNAWLIHGASRLQDAEALKARPDIAAQLGPSELTYLSACRARLDRQEALDRQRMRLRQWLQWGAVAAALVFAVLGLVAVGQWREAASQRTIAVGEAKKATARTAEAEAQRNATLLTQSRFLADLSLQKTRAGDAGAGMLLALVALSSSDEATRPYAPDAERALFAARLQFRERLVLLGNRNTMGDAAFSPDGRVIVTSTASVDRRDEQVRMWDAVSGLQKMVLTGVGWTGSAGRVAFSPDSHLVAVPSKKAILVWDVNIGRMVARLVGHTGEVRHISFSRDGRRLVSSSWWGETVARLWDPATGRLLATLKGHTKDLNMAVFSPDGTKVATASLDNTAQVFDAATGNAITVLEGHSAPVTSVAFSPDSHLIATTSSDNTVRLWNSTNGMRLVTMRHGDIVWGATFSPDGDKILTWDETRGHVWDVASGRELGLLAGHEKKIVGASFSPDNRHIVTASEDWTARVWDAGTLKPEIVLRGHQNQLTSAHFSSDSREIVTASYDATARVWSLDPIVKPQVLKGHESYVEQIAFSPSGDRVATTSLAGSASSGSARIWKVDMPMLDPVLLPEETLFAKMHRLSFSPDGKRVATASNDGSATIWDAEAGREVRKIRMSEGGVKSVSFSPDGRFALTVPGEDFRYRRGGNDVQIWSLEDGRRIAVLPHKTESIKAAMFGGRGERIATLAGEVVNIWNARDGSLVAKLDGRKSAVSFSAEGESIVTASRSIDVYDAKTGSIRSSRKLALRGQEDSENAVFSRDGRRVAFWGFAAASIVDVSDGTVVSLERNDGRSTFDMTFSADGQRLLVAMFDRVAIFDTASGGRLREIPANDVRHVAYGPDGTHIAFAPLGEEAFVYDLPPTTQALIDDARRLVRRCLSESQRRAAYLEPARPAWCSTMGKILQ